MLQDSVKADKLLKPIFISLLVTLLISLFLNIFLTYKLQESYKNLAECKSAKSQPQIECPACSEQKTCKSFDWVSKYVEVIEGDIQWQDCGEGDNICAFWEDYNRDSPLPKAEIKKCFQEGTRLENGALITGLPVGEHIIVGATVRPCLDVQSGE